MRTVSSIAEKKKLAEIYGYFLGKWNKFTEEDMWARVLDPGPHIKSDSPVQHVKESWRVHVLIKSNPSNLII